MISFDYKMDIQSAISKLADLDTQQTALEELSVLLSSSAKDQDKLQSFISALNHVSETSLTPLQTKEYLKLYGFVAEVLEEDCQSLIPELVSSLQKKLSKGNPDLHEGIAQSFGMIVHNTMHTFPDLPSSCNSLGNIFDMLFGNLQTPNKILQVGSALALTKVIQHSPLECLKFMQNRLAATTVDLLKTSNLKCHPQLITSLISLILSVEKDFSEFAESTVPILIHCLNNDLGRKQAVDALYTIAKVLPEQVNLFANEVLEALEPHRNDKYKPLRDAVTETLTLYKEFEPPSQREYKSIKEGPVNERFFQADNQDLIFEAKPEVSLGFQTFHPSQIQQTFHQPQIQPTSGAPQSLQHTPARNGSEHNNRLNILDAKSQVLREKFIELKEFTTSELGFMKQRMNAIENMLSTISTLYDTKLKQFMAHPSIAYLLK